MIHEACDGDMTCKVKFRCENTETEVLGCGFRNKVGPPPSAGTRGVSEFVLLFLPRTPKSPPKPPWLINYILATLEPI